jgi:multidrug transporter EmrE-like cation transporter
MSVPQLTMLSAIEIVGDYGLKEYANGGGWAYLATGVVGYIGVVVALIVNLQGSSILLVNNAWDGMSTLMESMFAYLVLGERFEHWSQYVGLIMIIAGLFLLKIPLKKDHGFRMPTFE